KVPDSCRARNVVARSQTSGAAPEVEPDLVPEFVPELVPEPVPELVTLPPDPFPVPRSPDDAEVTRTIRGSTPRRHRGWCRRSAPARARGRAGRSGPPWHPRPGGRPGRAS